MQAELIYNPSGGQVVIRHELDHVIAFLGSRGWSITRRETGSLSQATELAHDAADRGVDVVVAAGGDGTVNAVANGLVNTDTALGVLPVGTTNSWALQMGIPALNPVFPGTQAARLVAGLEERITRPLPASLHRKVLLNAARVLVEGVTAATDVGEVSGRYFLISTGIGLEAAIVGSISLKEKRALGSWAYVLTAIESAYRYTGADVRLRLDGTDLTVSTPLIVVTNIQLYGGMAAVGPKACVNDGRLDVCILKGEGFLTFVQYAMKILTHRHLSDPKVNYYQCREIVVESAPPLPVHVDGDAFSTTPVTIHAVPSALKVIVPRRLPANLFRAST